MARTIGSLLLACVLLTVAGVNLVIKDQSGKSCGIISFNELETAEVVNGTASSQRYATAGDFQPITLDVCADAAPGRDAIISFEARNADYAGFITLSFTKQSVNGSGYYLSEAKANTSLASYNGVYNLTSSNITSDFVGYKCPMLEIAVAQSFQMKFVNFSVQPFGVKHNQSQVLPDADGRYGSCQASPTTVAPTGNMTTATPGNVTTATPGNVTTIAPGNMTTPTPGNVTTATPGNVTTIAPGNMTTSAPANMTTATPGNVTTATPGNVTTTANGNMTTIYPGNMTTTRNGNMTTMYPGNITTRTIPRNITTTRHITTQTPCPPCNCPTVAPVTKVEKASSGTIAGTAVGCLLGGMLLGGGGVFFLMSRRNQYSLMY